MTMPARKIRSVAPFYMLLGGALGLVLGFASGYLIGNNANRLTPVNTPAGSEILPYINAEGGYSLFYPQGYSVAPLDESQSVIYYGSILSTEHPKATIQVEPANGRDIDQVTDELLAMFAGFDLETTFGYVVGGEQAVRVISGIPGQDLFRTMLILHGDTLYRLSFYPDDPSNSDLYQRMEALFETISGSFKFLD